MRRLAALTILLFACSRESTPTSAASPTAITASTSAPSPPTTDVRPSCVTGPYFALTRAQPGFPTTANEACEALEWSDPSEAGTFLRLSDADQHARLAAEGSRSPEDIEHARCRPVRFVGWPEGTCVTSMGRHTVWEQPIGVYVPDRGALRLAYAYVVWSKNVPLRVELATFFPGGVTMPVVQHSQGGATAVMPMGSPC